MILAHTSSSIFVGCPASDLNILVDSMDMEHENTG